MSGSRDAAALKTLREGSELEALQPQDQRR